MEQTISISLPLGVYQQLQRTADLTQQPLESIITASLTHTLSPLLAEIPTAYQADVYPLLHMDVEELQRESQRVFPEERWHQYEWLLEQKKARQLTETEGQQLDNLRYEADLLTLRKGYAAVLLKRRGYAVPPLEPIA